MAKPLVLAIFGTRPEAVKLAPVVHELRQSKELRTGICVTAQHRQMLDQMLADFRLRPDDDLGLMRERQDLAEFSARALLGLRAILRKRKPSFLLVQGDTTTTFIAALAAFYERIPVGHVEAGLRSFDKLNPFPEEANRVLTDRLCELHFAATETARRNLRREGLPPSNIYVTGNTVIDALRWSLRRPHAFRDPVLRKALAELGPKDKPVLVTTHRRENLGTPLRGFCRAFSALLEKHPELRLFYPLHMNPQVQKTVRRLLRHPRAHLLAPLDYFDFTRLLRRCSFAMTDSGGIQEEAPFLGIPVLVLREVTERPELLEAGIGRLAGTRPETIFALASRLLREPDFHRSMARKVALYGDGHAARRIVQALRRRLGVARRGPRDFSSPFPSEAGK